MIFMATVVSLHTHGESDQSLGPGGSRPGVFTLRSITCWGPTQQFLGRHRDGFYIEKMPVLSFGSLPGCSENIHGRAL